MKHAALAALWTLLAAATLPAAEPEAASRSEFQPRTPRDVRLAADDFRRSWPTVHADAVDRLTPLEEDWLVEGGPGWTGLGPLMEGWYESLPPDRRREAIEHRERIARNLPPDSPALLRRFDLTPSGVRARRGQAARYRDEGRHELAAAAWGRLIRHPLLTPNERALALLAVVHNLQDAGRPDAARRAWEAGRDAFASVPATLRGETLPLEEWVARLRLDPPAAESNEALPSSADWDAPFPFAPAVANDCDRWMNLFGEQGGPPYSTFAPTGGDEFVVARGVDGPAAFSLKDGTRRWPPETAPPTHDGSDNNRAVWKGLEAFRRTQAYGRLSRMTVTDGLLVVVEAPSLVPAPPPVRAADLSPDGPEQILKPYNWLAAYDLPTGALRWKIGGRSAGATYQFGNTAFLGPPVAVDDHLFVLALKDDSLRLLALQRDHGQLLWSLTLGDRLHPDAAAATLEFEAHSPVWHDGRLYCPVGPSEIACVDVTARSFEWKADWEPDLAPLRRTQFFLHDLLLGGWWRTWRDLQILPAGETLVVAAPGTSYLLGQDARTGRLRWKVPRGDGVGLIGLRNAGTVCLIADTHGVTARAADDGRPLWSTSLPALAGRPAVVGDELCVPLAEGRLARLDPDDGRVVAVSPPGFLPEHAALSAVPGGFVAQHPEGLSRRSWPATDAAESSDEGPAAAAFRRGDFLRAWEQLLPVPLDAATIDLQARIGIELLKTRALPREAITARLFEHLAPPARHRELLIALAESFLEDGERIAAGRHLAAAFLAAPADSSVSWSDRNDRRRVRSDRHYAGLWDRVLREATPAERVELETVWTTLREAAVAQDKHRALDGLATAFQPLYWGRRLALDEPAAVFAGVAGPVLELRLLAVARSSADPDQAAAGAVAWVEHLSRQHYPEDARAWARHLWRRSPGELARAPWREWLTGPPARPPHRAWEPGAPLRVVPDPRVARGVDAPPVPIEFVDGTLPNHLDVEVIREGATATLRFTDTAKGIWQLGLPRTAASLRSVDASDAGWCVGRVIVLRLGRALFAVTPFDERGEPRAAVVWSRDLERSSPANLIGHWTEPVAPPTIARAPVARLHNRFGNFAGSVGPVRAGYLCCWSGGRLTAVDTATGETLWVRDDLRPTPDVTGDEETIYLLQRHADSAGGTDVVLVSPVDGRTRGRVPFAPAPDRVVRLGESSAWTLTPAEGGARFERHDLASGRCLWSRDLAADVVPCELDDETWGLLHADGLLEFCSADDGALVSEAITIPVPPALSKVVVGRDGERWYLAASAAPPARKPDDFVTVPPNDGRAELINGFVTAVDRQRFDAAWSRPLRDEPWPRDLPRAFPFAKQEWRTPDRSGSSSRPSRLHFRVIDRVSGAALPFRPTLAGGSLTLEAVGPDRINVSVHRDRFELHYGPPEP